ncbi:biotin--[acetyl-CoA-carboxylase] ligase [Gracilibacillus kekensis]|uniref:Bifunctional ligase/repressor BirA n=1 Tax=Gracilibacillus kekensis TaxID=1027249 RepID=A0A1M7PPN6_9BACI|nr:biotin--[acetyl-CoA-carboxylase] ligase [Gracilibacillus kekensis]SHN19301.1 BirA family transcriptional regulator, biotin operon repressor / biotin-[acetyl-CoA-carboxylase] ligase [Gracilibacillus kekensis]
MVNKKRHELIAILSQNENQFISGQTLSEKLDVSRTAIWKHINELKKDGYQFESAPKKGYRLLTKPDQLNETTIKWGLETEWLGKSIIFKEKIDSTQDVAHRLARKGAEHGTIIIADRQLSGRGRMERQWISDDSGGIWLSMILRPPIPPHQASQMTLFVAVTLVEALERATGLSIQIKWPNDLFINGKKITGILTEMQAELEAIQYLIIGFGINVNQNIDHFPEEIRDLVTSLQIVSGKEWNRTNLVQTILQEFEEAYQNYIDNGFELVKKKWIAHAYKLHEKIWIKTTQASFYATVQGISNEGALIVRNENGEEKLIYSAEINW